MIDYEKLDCRIFFFFINMYPKFFMLARAMDNFPLLVF
jgi:hypothetical protein